MAEWQLRDYRVDPAHFDDFLAAWTAGVLPLRRAAGFTIEAWAIEADARFVWLIGYDGPDSFEDADAAYYASPARVALDPDPAQWVLDRYHAMVKPVTRALAGEPPPQ